MAWGVPRATPSRMPVVFKQVLFQVQRASATSKAISQSLPYLSGSPALNSGPLCLLSVIGPLNCEPLPRRQELSSAQTSSPCLSHLRRPSPNPHTSQNISEKCHHAAAPPTCLSFSLDCFPEESPRNLGSWHGNAHPPLGAKDLLWALLHSAQCGPRSSPLQICQVGPPQHPSQEVELL